jgi:Protein of unknown function (DUF3311)
VKRPSLGSIALGLVPFAGVCFSVSLWDRVYPMVFGIPFNFFWLISWLALTPLCMWCAYRLEVRRTPEAPRRSTHEGGTP